MKKKSYKTIKNFQLFSFYRFTKIKDKKQLKMFIENKLKNKIVRGTVLLSNEGINGSISGEKVLLDEFIVSLKRELNIKKLNINSNKINFLPFNRLKIRIKKEIISTGRNYNLKDKFRNNHVSPSEWHKMLKTEKLKIIDVRNDYEISIGKFRNAINPHTSSFREFPDTIKNMKISRDDKIGIYCTGGIRCEKASKQLTLLGYKNVYQLEGGIINYLKYAKRTKVKTMWTGECFVFDDRVTINSNLDKGKFFQCYGCRRPIQKKDFKSKYYKKGVHCPYCYKYKTEKKIKSSTTRQQQIDNAIRNKSESPFIKIE